MSLACYIRLLLWFNDGEDGQVGKRSLGWKTIPKRLLGQALETIHRKVFATFLFATLPTVFRGFRTMPPELPHLAHRIN
jgi:hypothetical protein